MEQKLARFAPLAGIAFVVLVLVGFGIEGTPPGTGDPASEVVDFYADNEAQVKTGSAFAAVGALALLLFGARLAAAMRELGSTLLSTVAISGAVITAAGIGVDSALRFAAADSADKISPEATQAIFATWNTFYWPMHLGIASFALAVSLHSFDSRLLPQWLAGIGILGAVLAMIPVAVILIIGLILLAVWLLITCVLLFRRAPATAAAPIGGS